ncbi:Catenin-beta-like protein [Parachaetomium inaequale]|uniref:Catenin-beta-like protein n=1 Tax=Parachaetomium inaequale TaxID=2588326 RepID=A0AAN6SLR7_9PEZI|nr:Catenin-beta-like protein [Parachaetomium inaequale]
MNIDELFQKSGLPSKRKLDPARDPTEIYKSAKHSSSTARHAHADDEADTEAGPLPPPDDNDAASSEGDYGPSAPPQDEEEDEPGDDAEGRFFGGGITRTEREMLDFIDTANPTNTTNTDDDAPIDTSWLKKTALAFEKKISLNASLRARYESLPHKFIDSEADLDGAIKALSILSDHPELYPDFARLGCVASLVSLLAHENTDIALDAVEIIGELTDEDVAASEEQWGALVDALLEADVLGLVVSNLGRLDEDALEADREGVYRALGVVENLCSKRETAEVVGGEEGLVKWLLGRVGKKESPVGQNKQYAAEILAVLVQSSRENRKRLAGLDAVDTMLQLVAAYRKRDPEKGGDEEEYMENLFEALTSIADEPEGKARFVEAEGVELCLIMLKEGKRSKPAALRLLDHAAGGPAGADVCQKIVDAGGLKTMFTMFMKKHDKQVTEHLVGIFASMLRLLPADSAERIRTLAKFVEKDYEKTAKLVTLRRDYAAVIGRVDERIKQEQQGMDADEREEMADEWFSRRLDAGLFCLQTIDVILAWLIAEDGGARKKIQTLLVDRDETFAVIQETIQEQIDGIDAELEESKETREMLTTLVQFLQ